MRHDRDPHPHLPAGPRDLRLARTQTVRHVRDAAAPPQPRRARAAARGGRDQRPDPGRGERLNRRGEHLMDIEWRRSSACANGNCVEVAYELERVFVKDSRGAAIELREDVWVDL